MAEPGGSDDKTAAVSSPSSVSAASSSYASSSSSSSLASSAAASTPGSRAPSVIIPEVDEVLERSSLKVTVHGVSEQQQQQQQQQRPLGESSTAGGGGGAARANRLSFHEQDVHIIPVPAAGPPDGATPGGDDEAPATGSSSSAAALEEGSVAADGEDPGKEKRKSLLQSLQSMIGGGSFRTDFTLGQRSLSNTINMRWARACVCVCVPWCD